VRDQSTVLAGQLLAGAGTLGFSLAAARMLFPGGYAQLASFLALYLVLGLPASGVTAATAVAPSATVHGRRVTLAAGSALGAGLAAAAPWLSPTLHLSLVQVVLLGLSAPALALLALQRGELYATRSHRRLVASLVSEPAARLVLGVPLAVVAGASGGAAAVAIGGYVALLVSGSPRARRAWHQPRGRPSDGGQYTPPQYDPPSYDPTVPSPPDQLDAPASRTRWTAIGFVLLVVVQCQDLLLANRLLPRAEAGQFAVLSTLGGLAVFATFTIPLVLLPRAGRGQRDGLRPAIVLTLVIGASAILLAAAAGGPIVELLFGTRYRAVIPLLVPYMAAMALLGLSRVLLAHRCAIGGGRAAAGVVLVAAVLQAALIIGYGHAPGSVAFSTLVASSGLAAGLAVTHLVPPGWPRRQVNRLRVTSRDPVARCVSAAFALGVAVRFVIPRGLWLDEATSVDQARMGYLAMLHNLRTTDVHPPGYFTLLWASVRVFGSGELAVRLPSIIPGALVIPALYLLGREAYDRRTGVIAAVAGSVAPIMVWYSQEARMYALLMLLGVLALWAQVRILKRGGVSGWVVYAGASAAMAWTQYFGLFQIAVQQVVFVAVIVARRRRGDPVRPLLIGWAATAAVIGLALVPLFAFAHQQFVVNQTGGKGFGGPQQAGNAAALTHNQLGVYSAVANLIWAVWGYHSNAALALLAALWPLGMLFAVGLLGRRPRTETLLLAAAIVVPAALLFALGSVKQNLFDIRYLSTAVPALFVLLARMLAGIPRRIWVSGLATVLFTTTLLAGLLDQQYNGSNPRTYDFRGAVHLVDARLHPGDTLVYAPADIREVVAYYADRPDVTLAPSGSAPKPGGAVYVVASQTLMNGPADAATLTHTLTEAGAGRTLILHRDLPNVEVWGFR
jgi:uncharacterized membrane protein/O-antigen/teichoic acid export membrane protein